MRIWGCRTRFYLKFVSCHIKSPVLNLPLFIARKLAFSKEKTFSRLIIRIAIAAVALSVAVMVAATALISGFKYEISRKIFEFWGHIHISDTAYSLSFEPKPVKIDQVFYPSLDTIRHIRYAMPMKVLGVETDDEKTIDSHGGIEHIQVFAHKPGIMRSKTAMDGILLKGIGKDFAWQHLEPYLKQGNVLQLSDTSASRDLLISQQTADRLQLQVGDKCVLHFVKGRDQLKRVFQICGIYKTGLEEYDRKFALCDIRQVQDLLGWQSDEVAGFEIWLQDLRDLNLYSQYIYDEILPPNLLSVSIKEKFPAIFEWLQLQDSNEIVVLSLMLAVAIVNMITALLVLVLERTRMIGLLKALGENNRKIRNIFLYYAAVILLSGIFWGNLIGLGFCFIQDHFHLITLKESDYYLSYAPIRMEWWSILGINVGTLLLTLLFLLLPSLAIARVSPVRAISFK